MVMIDTKLKEKKLYLMDPTNINLDNYTNMVNQLLELGSFSSEYKSYDTNKKDMITFICFDIVSRIVKGNLTIQEFEYQGNLIFTYNKANHKICIYELPKYGEDENSIPIFTGDILSMILEKVKTDTDIKDLDIEFIDTYQKIAIDNSLKIILPQIEQTVNYKRMILIYEQMRQEEEQIRNEVLKEKRRKDREDAIKERVIAKKSIIYGIDRRDYENYLDYLNAVNQKICEVCDYKINNIKRHIEANKKIYIDLLKKNDRDDDRESRTLKYIYDYGYRGRCKEEVWRKLKDVLRDNGITDESIELYYELVFQYDSDLSIKDSLVSLLNQIRIDRSWNDHFDGKRIENPDTMYHFMLGVEGYKSNHPEIIEYPNPILNKYVNQDDFKKCADVLFQIISLKEQLSYYESIKANPDRALLNFQNRSDSWNSILNFPYWIRLGRDTSKKTSDCFKESFNLFMIKPGVQNIDFKHIRMFTRNHGQEFGSTKAERQEYLKKVIQGEENCLYCDRLMITIPKSLNFKSIIGLIDYAHHYGKQIQFVCENPDMASTIKEILVDRAISGFRQESPKRKRYFKDRCFICVDPSYYDNFMLDTPSNKAFWHRYDYTGSYKFRKKEPASLDYVIDRTIYENIHDSRIDYDQVSKQLLGSYSSEEPEVHPVDISLLDFMNRSELHRYAECQGLDPDDVEKRYDDRFDDRIRDQLYTCAYQDVVNIPKEQKAYTKGLKYPFRNNKG